MKIGMFDSGIGGITVLKKLLEDNIEREYLYYADTINLPYGGKTKEELIDIGKNIIKFFEEKEVDLIIIACGTCSSLVEEYRKFTNIKIIDVITPTIEFIKNKYKTVGLLATESTINNKIFETKLNENNIIVEPIACPDFVPYIEGLTDTKPDMTKLNKIKDSEAIILGCTHYPLLKEEIVNYTKLPIIEMGIGISNIIKEENSTNKHITVYVSKSTSDLESRIENLLDKDVDIINLDV